MRCILSQSPTTRARASFLDCGEVHPRHYGLLGLLACFFLACFVSAASESKPDLTGTWQTQDSGMTWVIQQKEDSIHITQTAKKSRKIELDCPTSGKECPVAGESAKASIWYNGPVLVEMETKGEKATRYRMTLSPDGKVLNVEITHIVPRDDKAETLYFEKQP